MSSPAFSPENPPAADNASPPLLLPIPPLETPVSPQSPLPLPLPPIPAVISSPVVSPPAPPLLPPLSPPIIISPAPSINLPPPIPPTATPPPFPLPVLTPPESSPPLISPPAPAVEMPTPRTPASSNTPPSPVIMDPQPPSTSPPATLSPLVPAAQSPETTQSPPRRRHSPRAPARSKATNLRGSKTLPSTTPVSPPSPAEAAVSPVAVPASQPVTGGGDGGGMPLTAEMPAPQPAVAVPLVVGGGGVAPAMAVLPVGANGSSDIRAAPVGGGGGTSAVGGVSTGIVAGLCVGGVVLVALLVFGILVVVCRRRRGCSFDDCGSFACTAKHDLQGKLSMASYTKRNTSCPDTEMWGGTNNLHQPALASYNGGSGSANSASTMGLAGVPMAVPSSGTFTYEELIAATSGFSEANLLGQGGFGYVHKGVLPNGKEVAVKQLKMGGQQGEREFRAEVDTISQVHHKHLVSLVGYCIAGAERLLVYEFLPNKTMEFHLHGKDQPVMDWSTRLKIAVGTGKGLAYLHEDCNPTIIHRDIKASNILLDFNFEVKVSDFGLAKIFSNTNPLVTHITTRVVGTFGYLAPEYASSGKVTDKSDVYSYGVMLLELITGRPPINTSESAMNGGSLVNWARPLLAQAMEEGNFDTLIDPRLQNNYNVDEMTNMVACAAACVRLSAWRRPRMSQVIRALEGDLSPSDLDDGVRPGHSSMHFPYESLDFDAQKYMEDMKKFRLALSNSTEADPTTDRYSENTSEYGLHPSISSGNSHESNTRSFQLDS